MRWWLVLCASALWTSVTSKETNEFKNVSNQSRARQCCPCPEDDLEPAANSPRSLTRSKQASGKGLQPLADIASVDCPCRFRDADSEGSASVVSPKAVRPFVRLEDEEEDTKPLLHPEVGLASSVLETLREATEKDYNEALARDAARSASLSMEPDGIAKESRNLFTYVVSPKQELDNVVVPEASHIHEARYINSPLGRTNTQRIPLLTNTPDLQRDILNLPLRNPSKIKSIFDLDSSVSTSNINKKVLAVSPENVLEGSMGNLNNDLNKPKVNDFLKNVHDTVFGLRTAANKAGKPTDETNVLHNILNLIPNMNSDKSLSQNKVDVNNDMLNSDSAISPSSVVERYSGLMSNSLFKIPQTEMEPINSSNKNAEKLSPIDSIKNKIFGTKIPQLNIPLIGRDASSDLLSDVIKSLEKTGNLLPLNLFNGQRQLPSIKSPDMENKEVQNVNPSLKDDKTFKTEIVDTIPTSSSVKPNPANVSTLDCLKKSESVNNNNAIEKIKVGTEILDNLSNSEVNIIDGSKASNEITEAYVKENALTDDDIMGTKIITHIPRNIDATVNNLESITNVDETDNSNINENFQSDKINCSDNKDDMFSDTSNNVANVASITEKSNYIFQRPPFDRSSSENLNEDLETHNTKPNLNGIEDSTVITDSDNIEVDTNNKLTFKENLLQRLESLKIPPKTTEIQETSINNDVKKETDKSNQLSIDDLQKMSNSLLDKEKVLIDALAEQTKKIIETKTDLNDKSQIVSSESLKTSKESLDANADASETSSLNQVVSSSKLECPSGVLSSKQTNLNENAQEMASEASERVANVVAPDSIIKTSILPNVVQPLPSLFNRYDNLFNRPIISLPNILNNPLPMLSSSRNFKTNEKIAKGNNLLSSDDSISKKDGEVLSLASTSNYKSALPPLQPLDDINLDFLQLKPLSLSKSSPLSGIPALPRLNLNSYKTKLALPKSLDLKPVLFESTLGNNKGMVGATVTFGKKKDEIGCKNSALQKVSDFHESLAVLPRLDDLRENFLEKAQDLLSTPLETSSRNMIEDTLRSSQVLTENFKVQAKNTAKDIKKSFEQSLKGVGLPRSSIFSKPLANSDFLQAVSVRHEDFGDKLKGIHQDFTDRLETLRNDFFDQIPSLSSPIPRQSIMKLQQPSRLSSKNKMNQLSLPQTKKTPGKFKFSTPRKDKNKTLKMQPASSVLSPRFAESPQSTATLPDLSHLHSMRKHAPLSSKLGSMNKPLLDILQHHKKTILNKPSLKPKLKENKVTITFSTTPRPANLKFKPSKAMADSQPKLKSKSLLEKDYSTLQSNIKSKTLPKSKFKSVSELAISPSELKFSKVGAPLRIPIRSKSTTIKDISKAAPSISSFKSKLPSSSNLKPPIFKNPLQIDETLRSVDENVVKSKTPSVSANTISNFNKEPLKTSLAATPPPSWPRTIDDTFLAKVREAVKARLAEIGSKNAKPASNIRLGKTGPAVEMARSASNKVEMVSPMIEPMVENTSYTCKMMCTKNS